MSEHEQTIFERIKKYQFLIGIATALVGSVVTSAITMITFSMNYGRALEQKEQQAAKVAVLEIRSADSDTAIANHRAIIYGNVFVRNVRAQYKESE